MVVVPLSTRAADSITPVVQSAARGTPVSGGVPMSDRPCTGCRSTSNGRLFFAYVNHYVGDDLERRRVRLCRECIVELLEPLVECADKQVDGRWTEIEKVLE